MTGGVAQLKSAGSNQRFVLDRIPAMEVHLFGEHCIECPP